MRADKEDLFSDSDKQFLMDMTDTAVNRIVKTILLISMEDQFFKAGRPATLPENPILDCSNTTNEIANEFPMRFES